MSNATEFVSEKAPANPAPGLNLGRVDAIYPEIGHHLAAMMRIMLKKMQNYPKAADLLSFKFIHPCQVRRFYILLHSPK